MEHPLIPVWLGADAAITALGFSTGEIATALGEGRGGCLPVDDPALFERPFVAGKVDGERLKALATLQGLQGFTPLEQGLILTIDEVIGCSGIDPSAGDCGLIVASTKGNIERLAAEGPVDEKVFLHAMAARVAERTGFKNPPIVVSNACISGVSAIVAAARLIRSGRYRHIVVAGGDRLTRFVATGFHAFKSVDGRVCRPYDASREGLTLGEGYGALLLTAQIERATVPYLEIAGGAISNDANHISGPSRTGDGLHFAIRGALKEAGVAPAEVGFVNGHGTGTVYNDEMESKAFVLSGLEKVPVNSLKPYFGHTLGAAGVIETILSAQGLRTGTIYGTPGFERSGTSCPLDVAPGHRPTAAAVCLKTASGFGGCNAAIVLRKSNATSPRMASVRHQRTVRQTAAVSIAPDGRPFGETIRRRFKALEQPDMKFFRMDDLSKLGYVAAGELLRGTGLGERYRPREIGLVLTNRSASLDTDRRHVHAIQAGDEASPALFVYTLPNVAAGEIAIRHKIQGETTFFIQDDPETEFVEAYARMLLRTGRLKAVIFGRCELLGEDFGAELTLLETLIQPPKAAR